jgi:hypothetical protein
LQDSLPGMDWHEKLLGAIAEARLAFGAANGFT